MRSLAWEFEMKDQILRYFQAEKAESALFLLLAAIAIAVSVLLLNSDSELKWGSAPLLVVALIQLVVGGTVFVRTNAQVTRLVDQLESDPLDYRAQELDRMVAVQRNFGLYKGIEIAIVVAGVALTYAFRERPALYGVGIGCIAQGAAMLVLDLVAERRADVYVEQIVKLVHPT